MNLGKRLWLIFLLSGVLLSLHAQNPQYVAYINKYKDLAIEQMNRYKIPASITLAQGLFESGAGQSSLAVRSNNHFGIKCGTDWSGRTAYSDDDARNECFRVYASVRDSYEDHSHFLMKRRYAALFQLGTTDYKGWAHGLKKAGYATNPAYAQKLIDLIELYRLYEYDTRSASKHPHFLFGHKEAVPVVQASDHQVLLVNGCLVLIARAGDTPASIGKEYGMKEKKILRCNDFYSGYTLTPGERVYLQKKKSKASRDYFRQKYIVKPGDSMHSISQAFGIRLKSLYKMNQMKPEDPMPKEGTPIRIR